MVLDLETLAFHRRLLTGSSHRGGDTRFSPHFQVHMLQRMYRHVPRLGGGFPMNEYTLEAVIINFSPVGAPLIAAVAAIAVVATIWAFKGPP